MNPQNMDSFKKLFGRRLGDIMRKRGLKVADLVDMLASFRWFPIEVAENTVRGWCDGVRMPSGQFLVVLAHVLNVSVEYLFGLDDRDVYTDLLNAFNGVMKKHGRITEFTEVGYLSAQGRYVQRMHCVNEVGDIYAAHRRYNTYSHLIENIYIIVDGNIYREDFYERYSSEILENSVSVYDIVNEAVKHGNPGMIEEMRKRYNGSRASLGIIGSLSADAFLFQMCYTLGYFSKHK